MDDLTERASLAAMRLYGMGENECAKAMADCREEIERLRAALEEIAAYECTCHEAYADRGLVDPSCMAAEVGDAARAALGQDPVCRGASR